MASTELYQEIAQNRVRLTDTLIAFVKTDTVLFPFNAASEQMYLPVLAAANAILDTVFELSYEVDVADCNLKQDDKVRGYLDKLSLEKFALLYLTAVEVRSVLLGVLFAEHQIDINQLLDVAFFEEKYQQSEWGMTEEALHRYECIKSKLSELGSMTYENGLYEN